MTTGKTTTPGKRGPKPGRRKNLAARSKLKVLVHEETAWKLRLEGHSYSAIAKKMGMTGGGAYQMVMRVLARHQAEEAEAVPQIRKMEVDRCDQYLLQLKKGCEKGNIGSIQTALKVAERRAKLLGLDSAIKVDPLAGEGGQVAVDLFRKMLTDATAVATAEEVEDAPV